VATWNSKNMKE